MKIDRKDYGFSRTGDQNRLRLGIQWKLEMEKRILGNVANAHVFAIRIVILARTHHVLIFASIMGENILELRSYAQSFPCPQHKEG